MKITLYITSIIIIAISIYLFIEFPNSGRKQFIAGAILPFGIIIGGLGFALNFIKAKPFRIERIIDSILQNKSFSEKQQ